MYVPAPFCFDILQTEANWLPHPVGGSRRPEYLLLN